MSLPTAVDPKLRIVEAHIGSGDDRSMPKNVGVAGQSRDRAFHKRTARTYDAWLGHFERWMGMGSARPRLLSRATGRVLEVGIGTGGNLVHYSAGVSLTGVDLSPTKLAHARRRAIELSREVDLRAGDGQQLDLPSGSFNTVTMTLFLSAVPDPKRALAEASRAIGGASVWPSHSWPGKDR